NNCVENKINLILLKKAANMKKVFVGLIILLTFSCKEKREGLENIEPSVGAISTPNEGIAGEGEIVPPQGSIKLTYNKEENVKLIENLPGYNKLTTDQKKKMKEKILSAVPSTLLPSSSSLLNEDPPNC